MAKKTPKTDNGELADNNEAHSSPLTFPCDFVVKIMGKTSESFEADMFALVHQHFPDITANSITKRQSKDGNYTALTITVHVKFKDELDALYHELSANEAVLVAL